MKFVISQVSLLIILVALITSSVKCQGSTENFTNRVGNLKEKPITILDWLLGFTSRNVSQNAVRFQTRNNNIPSSNQTTFVYAHEDFDNYSVSALAGFPQNISTSIPGNMNQSHSRIVTQNLPRVGRQYFPPSRRRNPHPPIAIIRNPGLVDYDSSNSPVPSATPSEPTYNLYWNTNDLSASGQSGHLADGDHNDFDEEEETQYNSDIDDPDPEDPIEEDSAGSDDYDADTSPSHYNSAHWKDMHNGRTRLKPNENNCTNSSCLLNTSEQQISHLQTLTISHKTKFGPNAATNLKVNNSKQAEPTGPGNPETTTIPSPTVSVSVTPDVPNTMVPTTSLSESTVSHDPQVSGSTSSATSIGPEMVSTTMASSAANPGTTTPTNTELPNPTTTSTATSSDTTLPVDPEVSTQSVSTENLPSTPVPSSSTTTTSTTTTTTTTPLPPPIGTISSTTTTVSPEMDTTQASPTPSTGTVTTTTTVPTTSTSTTPLPPPIGTISSTTTTVSPEMDTTQASPTPSTGAVTRTTTVPTASTSAVPLTETTPKPVISPVPTAPLKPLPEASLPPPLNTEAPIITEPTTLPSMEAESYTTTPPTISQTELVTEPGLPPVTNTPPTDPQITDPPVDSESPITAPPVPSNTNTPTIPWFTDPPTEPTFTDPPTEPIFTDPPTEPTFTDPPTEPWFTDPPTEPTFTDPPTEPWFTDPPTDPTFTEPPTELPFTEPPITDPTTVPTFTDLPTEPPITDLPPETTSATVTSTDQPGSTDSTTMKPMKPPPPFNATLRCQCGVQSTSAHNVGNTLIRLQTNPWLVEISVRGRHRCAGTLINDRYVLTAASCVRRIQSRSDLTVTTGLQSKFPVQHSVYKVSIHPKYDVKTMSNNVAVLRIRVPIEPGPSARPVCLPFTNPHSNYGSASLSTWINTRGRLSVLQSDVQLLNKTTCQGVLNITESSPDNIGNGTFCAEAPAQKSCLGDTGGPLQAYVGKFSYEQIGLVSWGVGCRSSGLPGVYSMVRPYIRWMLFQMRDAQFCRDRRPKQKDLFKFFELEDQI